MQVFGNIGLAQQVFHQHVQEPGNHRYGTRSSRLDPDRDGDNGNGSDDRFTPSNAQNSAPSAQDAGLYQPTQIEFFSASATFLMVQAGTSQATQSGTSGSSTTAATTQGAAIDPTASQTSVATPSATVAGQSSPDTPVATTTAAPVDASVPTTATTTTQGPTASQVSTPVSTDSQNPLQALNAALASLGLSQQDIQAFDQVASFIQSVSPAAFTDLVNELQALAQQTTSGNAATGNSATGNTTTGNTAAGGSVQVEELAIQFSGFEVQGTSGNGTSSGSATGSGTGTGSSTTQGNPGSTGSEQISAFNLQVEEVDFTLTNSAGQSTQTQTPQPASIVTRRNPPVVPENLHAPNRQSVVYAVTDNVLAADCAAVAPAPSSNCCRSCASVLYACCAVAKLPAWSACPNWPKICVMGFCWLPLEF